MVVPDPIIAQEQNFLSMIPKPSSTPKAQAPVSQGPFLSPNDVLAQMQSFLTKIPANIPPSIPPDQRQNYLALLGALETFDFNRLASYDETLGTAARLVYGARAGNKGYLATVAGSSSQMQNVLNQFQKKAGTAGVASQGAGLAVGVAVSAALISTGVGAPIGAAIAAVSQGLPGVEALSTSANREHDLENRRNAVQNNTLLDYTFKQNLLSYQNALIAQRPKCVAVFDSTCAKEHLNYAARVDLFNSCVDFLTAFLSKLPSMFALPTDAGASQIATPQGMSAKAPSGLVIVGILAAVSLILVFVV